jgi:hypothetical protein
MRSKQLPISSGTRLRRVSLSGAFRTKGGATVRKLFRTRSLHQFINCVVVVDQVLRAAVVVRDRRAGDVDTQVSVDRGEDFLHVDRAVCSVLGEVVGRADDRASRSERSCR